MGRYKSHKKQNPLMRKSKLRANANNSQTFQELKEEEFNIIMTPEVSNRVATEVLPVRNSVSKSKNSKVPTLNLKKKINSYS
jgi:hypothetical protein